MKSVLGLKLNPWHDTGAAIIAEDSGMLKVAAVSQERIDRVKHSRAFPQGAIDYCLKTVGIRLEDLSLVVADFIMSPDIADHFPNTCDPQSALKAEFFRRLRDCNTQVSFAEHHLCHAASAYFATEWEDATSLVIDGHGSRYETQTIFNCEGNSISKLATSNKAGIGWMYSVITEMLLGFGHLQEGKTMGLAGWADLRHWGAPVVIAEKVTGGPDQIVYEQYMRLNDRRCWEMALPAGMPRRVPQDDPSSYPYVAYAHAAQEELERAVLELARYAKNDAPKRRLCYAGGVALNISANRVLVDSGLFQEVFIQPAATDSGIPLGAALLGYYTMLGGSVRWHMSHAYLGKEYSDETMDAAVESWSGQVSVYEPDSVARILANNYIIGWFQGASEYGPRALGHRSILCSPRHLRMKDYLNQEVKHREPFRPFAPIVPMERQYEIFDLAASSPYMLLNCTVRSSKREEIAAVVHADGTARVQSIDSATQPQLHSLLLHFGELSFLPVLLNTSMNLAGEPIIETPMEAVSFLARTSLDALVLGDHILSKRPLRELVRNHNSAFLEFASSSVPSPRMRDGPT